MYGRARQPGRLAHSFAGRFVYVAALTLAHGNHGDNKLIVYHLTEQTKAGCSEFNCVTVLYTTELCGKNMGVLTTLFKLSGKLLLDSLVQLVPFL